MNIVKIMSVFGTRPEAIKMCPLIQEIEQNARCESITCVTGQHRQMLDQVLNVFGVKPKYDLDIMQPNQTLSLITQQIIEKIDPLLKLEKPDIVLVHGDTTTSFAAALSSFYNQIAVGHVEAGLRTYQMYSPFPEEMNRVLTSRLATLHFAPTELNRMNLIRENVLDNIFVTGNTVLDSFNTTVKENYIFSNNKLKYLDNSSAKVILVTAHRRENIGANLQNICNALKRIVNMRDDVLIIYPVHLNPAIKDNVKKMLGKVDRVLLVDPLDVSDLHNLMVKSHLILTDSGGLQEEGPHFKKPVLVLRTETERPEAVEAGCVKIIGVDEENIVNETIKVLDDKDIYESFLLNDNPYGDGKASKKIVDHILQWKRIGTF